jgi:hypothetical protein
LGDIEIVVGQVEILIVFDADEFQARTQELLVNRGGFTGLDVGADHVERRRVLVMGQQKFEHNLVVVEIHTMNLNQVTAILGGVFVDNVSDASLREDGAVAIANDDFTIVGCVEINGIFGSGPLRRRSLHNPRRPPRKAAATGPSAPAIQVFNVGTSIKARATLTNENRIEEGER